MKYKVWRSNKDKSLHLLCTEGSEAFESLPAAIRNLGPWQGSKEGEIGGLRLAYRLLLVEQKFVVIHAHVSELQLEATGVQLHPANTECPTCKGSGNVPMHGGLRQKDCPRCSGNGWIKAQSRR